MAGIAVTRYRFLGREVFLAIGVLPLIIPYVVLAVALVILFNQFGIQRSLWTVGVSHVIISIPYVMLLVAARLSEFNKSLEEASMDLGASYWETLLRITLPISAPALISGFLLSVITSLDEIALAYYLVGTDNTLPMYIYSQLRFPRRLPMILALSSLIMLSTLVIILFSEWLQRVKMPAGSVGAKHVQSASPTLPGASARRDAKQP